MALKDNTNPNIDYLNTEVVEGGILNEQGVLNIALSFFDLIRCFYVKTDDTSIVSGKTYYTYSNGTYTAVASPTASALNTYYEDSKEKEVVLFKQYLPLAELECARLSDWSFLIKTATYGEDDIVNSESTTKDSELDAGYYKEKNEDGTYTAYQMFKNFRYGFSLPSDFLKAKYINGKMNEGFAKKGNTIYTNYKSMTVDYVSNSISGIPSDFGYLIACKVAMDIGILVDPNGEGLKRATTQFSTIYQTLKTNDDANFRLENPKQDYYINPSSGFFNALEPRHEAHR